MVSNNTKFPEPNLAKREGTLDGMYSVLFVNTALKDYSFRTEYPWNLRFFVAYKANPENGMPTEKEKRSLDGFEALLFKALRRASDTHFIGYSDWNGGREYMFYVNEPGAVDEELQASMTQAKVSRESEYEICEDPSWEAVEYFFDF